jgi:DNA-binding beta-propeller fold protein YncE
MTRLAIIAFSLFLAMVVSLLPFAAQAKVDWEVSNAIQLEETPVAVAQTQGGSLTFILTDQAKVVIYSADGKRIGTVPVDPSVTDIAISAKGEQLYLINSKRNTLKTLDINFIVDFNVDDAPFLGPAEAKVVVAVFSDFQ